MSHSEKVYALEDATRWLHEYGLVLCPLVNRICVVGSVRRQKKAGVHDLEVLVIPLPSSQMNLFGAPMPGNRLDEEIKRLAQEWNAELLVNGPMTKKLRLVEGPMLEIYVSTPGRWGVEMVIKTGDADFSHKAVLLRKYGGYLPSNCVIKDGWKVYRNGNPLPMLEEGDFLELLGFPADLDPQVRSGKSVPTY